MVICTFIFHATFFSKWAVPYRPKKNKWATFNKSNLRHFILKFFSSTENYRGQCHIAPLPPMAALPYPAIATKFVVKRPVCLFE